MFSLNTTVAVRRSRAEEFLDNVSDRIFAANDLARESEGFEVTAPTRFTRKYRDPRLAVALHVRAIRDQRNEVES